MQHNEILGAEIRKAAWNVRPDAIGHVENEKGGAGDDGGPPRPQPDLAVIAAAAACEVQALQVRGTAEEAGGMGVWQRAGSAAQSAQVMQASQAVQHGHAALAAATVTAAATIAKATAGATPSVARLYGEYGVLRQQPKLRGGYFAPSSAPKPIARGGIVASGSTSSSSRSAGSVAQASTSEAKDKCRVGAGGGVRQLGRARGWNSGDDGRLMGATGIRIGHHGSKSEQWESLLG